MVRQDINNLAYPRKKQPKQKIDEPAKDDTKKENNVGSTSKQKAHKPDQKDDKRTREPSPPPQQPDTHGKQVHRDDIIVRIAVRQMEEKGIKLDLSRLS
ncbi:hypothetical protein D9613_011894 [Agrocybe pediades]|uniref:Uncharacterized protein n=1 Tax=Agrocybe pediades TaxID=84607 RepID=A0A8H4QKY1_9AGAR|nr:hypothetical protein D9613_011894 [Agrocybe pediades]